MPWWCICWSKGNQSLFLERSNCCNLLVTPPSSPEYAVSSLVDLPSPDNGDVAVERGLHEKRAAVELPRFSLLTLLQHSARRVEANRDLAFLDQRVFKDLSVYEPSPIQATWPRSVVLTGSSRRKESRNASAGSTDTFGQSSLRAELDRHFSSKILLLEGLVASEE